MPSSTLFWHLVTRLGEIQIVLPAALISSLPVLANPRTRAFAMRWLGALALAISLTTATKLAFIGWGLGIGSLDFTGISGHAMMASSVYPLLFAFWTSRWPGHVQRAAFFCGCILALLVGVSRLEVHAHSVSEVMAGLALGLAVGVVCTWRRPLPARVSSPVVQVLIMTWILITPQHTPQSPTHQWVTRLSLALAGRDTPYTRADMLRNTRQAL